MKVLHKPKDMAVNRLLPESFALLGYMFILNWHLSDNPYVDYTKPYIWILRLFAILPHSCICTTFLSESLYKKNVLSYEISTPFDMIQFVCILYVCVEWI